MLSFSPYSKIAIVWSSSQINITNMVVLHAYGLQHFACITNSSLCELGVEALIELCSNTHTHVCTLEEIVIHENHQESIKFWMGLALFFPVYKDAGGRLWMSKKKQKNH